MQAKAPKEGNPRSSFCKKLLVLCQHCGWGLTTDSSPFP